MDQLLTVIKYITDSLGAMVIMPLFLIILGLFFRMPLSKALRSGLLVGIGFQGINVIIGLLGTTVTPAATAMAESVGITFNIMDVGFPTVGAAAWTTPIAALVVPIAIVINIIFLTLNWTKTLNIDIWNMFHFILAGGVAYMVTGNLLIGMVIAVIFMIITMKIADWNAPVWQKAFGLEGTSCTTLSIMPSMLLGWGVNKVIDLIPGVRDFDINPSKVDSLKGIGDPMFLGFIIGVILGILGRLPLADILNTGVGLAAAMVILPKMVALLMEGLSPISAAATKYMRGRFKDRDLYIGMDCALGAGDPTVIACSTIMIPIAVALAIILPGNGFLPIVSLTGLIYFCVPIVAASKNNLFRSLVSMIILYIIHLYIITALAPTITEFVTWAGVELPEGATLIAGGNPENFFLLLVRPILSIFGFGG